MAYVFKLDGDNGDETCVIHIPKCWGRTIVEAFAQAQAGYEKRHDGHGHDLPSRWDYARIVAFVREPATWLRSFWGHRKHGRWSEDRSSTPYTILSNMVQPYASDNFDEFALGVTANLPGVIGWFFGLYTPPPVTVIQVENASVYLKELGVDINAVDPLGVRDDLPPISEYIRDLIIAAEVSTYIRYKYKAKS